MRNWHIRAIAHRLEGVTEGSVKRLIITQPPRSLKSICTSVAYVAWRLGQDPSLRFICVSYSQDLADKLAEQFRSVVSRTWYRELFPGMRIKRDTAHELTTTRGGGRYATSTGGTLTGRGADLIIIDDPMKAADALSEIERRKTIDWFRNTLITRLNDKKAGAIILVMQRLHEEDLAGHLYEDGGWDCLDLPAIAIDREEIPIGPQKTHVRLVGDILHPEREGPEQLEQMKRSLGSLAFSAQYQQRPTPLEGNLVKRDWFRTYDTPPSGQSARIVQSWDVAGSTGEDRDYSVCTTWAVQNKNFYLLDVWRGRLEIPQLKRKIIALQRHHQAGRVLIEKAGLGLGLCQDLRDDTSVSFNPITVKPVGDKLTRFEAQTSKIEAGQVLIPKEAPWLATFLNEILAFPNGRHDDQVDSVSQFLGDTRHRPKLPALGIAGERIRLESPFLS